MLLTPKDIGTLVDHTVWQRGKVLDVTPPYAIIHFTSLLETPQGPERKLREDAPQISKSKVQSDPELDLIGTGAAKPKKSKSKAKAKGLVHHLDEAITWFEKTYPKKFEDDKFIDADLRNKRAAHDVFVANFGGSRGQKLIDQGKHAEIADVLDALFKATNIPSTFEVKAVHKGLKKGEHAGTQILEAALAFISKPDSTKFAALFEAVAQLPSDGGKVLTWPNITLCALRRACSTCRTWVSCGSQGRAPPPASRVRSSRTRPDSRSVVPTTRCCALRTAASSMT